MMFSNTHTGYVNYGIVALFFLILSPVTLAQWQFGIAGGINLGTVRLNWENTPQPEIYPRFGYSLGLGSEIKLKHDLSFLTELNLISKNYAINPEFYGKETEGFDRYSLLYLDLPIKISYSFNHTRFFAGTFIDYCFSGSEKYNLVFADSIINEGHSTVLSRKRFKSNEINYPKQGVYVFDGGILLGVGYICHSYCLDLSYIQGLINIYPDIEGIDRRCLTMRTMLLNLDLFFYF